MMNRSVLVFLCLVILPFSAFGSEIDDHVYSLACRKEIKAAIPKNLLALRWRAKFQSLPLKPLYTSLEFRDSKNGKAYEVFGDSNVGYYSVASKSSETTFSWDRNAGCKKKEVTSRLPASVPASSGFNDAELAKTLKANKAGVIFVWSPHMPLSVKALDEIRAAAKDQKLLLTVVMDHEANQKDAETWLTKKKVQKTDLLRVESAELMGHDLQLHYPIALMYQNGFISNHSFVGHKYRAGYVDWLKQESAILKKEAGLL